MIWGASGLDISNVPAWNVTFKGNATWDGDFSKNFAKAAN